MIETLDLTKRYGDKVAVDRLTITVSPGEVTGFLGPNGAGKSTTMRMIVGLDHPTSGYAFLNGKLYRDHRDPLHQVGVLLDVKAMHPGRTARAQLRAVAATQGLRATRVDEVLELTGLAKVANRRLGKFSLGMSQRLGLACALLADPVVLILDEPLNGLDPEGVLWVRNLVRDEASRGKTVFLSSHLMSEMALVADRLVVLGRGRLLAQERMAQFIAKSSDVAARVRSADVAQLAEVLAGPGVRIDALERGVIEVHGRSTEEIARTAAEHGWLLSELTAIQVSLEDAYMKLTQDDVEYGSDARSGSARNEAPEQGGWR